MNAPSDSSLILKYFPEISTKQKEQFSQLHELYAFWNEQINVVSRRDIDNIYEHHVLHSLGIAKVISFKPHTTVLDVGTGGGFPGIPLAILFPEVNFLLVDSIGKKIKVANEVIAALDLKNVEAKQLRAEQITEKFDFVVSRAVAPLPEILNWINGKIKKENQNDLPNGLLYLKGGEMAAELKSLNKKSKVFSLSDYFEEDFFETKKVVWVG